MHQLLQKLLSKRGIKKPDELAPMEKADFDRWNRILSAEGDITVDKIAEFCRSQISLIEAKWRKLEETDGKMAKLVVQHTVYKAVLSGITGPKAEREGTERYLQTLIDS